MLDATVQSPSGLVALLVGMGLWAWVAGHLGEGGHLRGGPWEFHVDRVVGVLIMVGAWREECGD